MKVTKSFTFDAAHALTNYHGACERLHGHTYRLDVTIEGPLNPATGMVVDFLLLKTVVQERIIARVDHNSLNDLLKNPSAELLAVWVWDELKNLRKYLVGAIKTTHFDRYVRTGKITKPVVSSQIKLAEVRVWETATSCVTYNGK